MRTIFDFDTPGFWPLIHDVRYSALDAAATNGVPLLVTTFCYAEPEDRDQFGKLEAIMQRRGGELLPVFLHCSREEAMRRVGNPDRVERRKMASGEAFGKLSRRQQFHRGTAGRLPQAGYRRCPGGNDRAENRRSFRARRLRPDIRSHYPRHCERSEAIQGVSGPGSVGCFAALAMTMPHQCRRALEPDNCPVGFSTSSAPPSPDVGNHALRARRISRCAPMPRTTLEETARGTGQTLSACVP